MTTPTGSTLESLLAAAYAAAGQRDWPGVERLAREAITRHGPNGDAFQLLGFIALETGNPAVAKDLFRRAVEQDGGRADFHFHAALAAQQSGDNANARLWTATAIRLSADYVPALRLSAELALSDKDQDALAVVEACLKYLPSDPDVLAWAASAANWQRNAGKVADYLKRAIAAAAGDRERLVQLGNNALLCWRPDLAANAFQAASGLPGSGDIEIGGITTAYHFMGQPERSLAETRRALSLFPDSSGLKWNEALFLLASGEAGPGWDAFEERTRFAPHITPPRFPGLPAWDGRPGSGRLLIWREQGVGDELIFATAYQDAAARWQGPVTILCDPRLVDLLSRSVPGVSFIGDARDGEVDLTGVSQGIASGSLPRLLRRQRQDFPTRAQSFTPDPARVDVVRKLLREWGPKPKIGICWRGLIRSVDRGPFYSDVADWLPLFRNPDLDVVALQYGLTDEERTAITKAGGRLLEVPGLDLKDDFDGVAALDIALDAVVSVDTAAAPLAAGTGTKTLWLTLPARWAMLGTGEHPWFPSSRTLIRQPGESWAPVVAQVITALAETVPARV